MYQWRKFEFFEEKYGAKCAVPENDEDDGVVAAERKIECCSSGRGKLVTGFDDGVVCFFDRGLKFNYSFQPHSSSVLFLQQLKVKKERSLLQFSEFLFLIVKFGEIVSRFSSRIKD